MTKQLKTYLSILEQNQTFLRDRFSVNKIAIFGSTSRGDNTQRSDIDIFVELTKPINLFAFLDFEKYLSSILGRKVDLTTKKAIKPSVKPAIIKEAVYV